MGSFAGNREGARKRIKLDMGSEVEEPIGVQGQNSCCGGWGPNPGFFISQLLRHKVGHAS